MKILVKAMCGACDARMWPCEVKQKELATQGYTRSILHPLVFVKIASVTSVVARVDEV